MGLLQLAERVEALTGPCRETDVMIELAVGKNGPAIQEIMAGSPHNTIDEVAKAADRDVSIMFHRVPRYTASLDAAMTLVPAGQDWMVDNFDGLAARMCSASVFNAKADDFGAFAATPALALCAAALRALAAKGDAGS